nr:hypothetical protein [uncultured Cohaesibacter sp.]
MSAEPEMDAGSKDKGEKNGCQINQPCWCHLPACQSHAPNAAERDHIDQRQLAGTDLVLRPYEFGAVSLCFGSIEIQSFFKKDAYQWSTLSPSVTSSRGYASRGKSIIAQVNILYNLKLNADGKII